MSTLCSMNAQEMRLAFLGTEIGRGHAFYLDELVEEFASVSGREPARASVFDVSRGAARRAWEAVRASYALGGSGKISSAIYRLVRGRPNYDVDSWMMRTLARDLRQWAKSKSAVVVDHPLLAGALRGHRQVWYMHGEMAVPRESAVQSAARIFVPCEDTANLFTSHGVERARLRVIGLCIERRLRDQASNCFPERQRRIASDSTLTAAFFSSGAEPKLHVRAIASAAIAFAAAGHRSLIFASRGGRLERAASLTSKGLEIVSYSNRSQLNSLTANEFPSMDVLVSPPHERSTWAAGLGLPIFLVGPDIGPFAPLNRAVLFRREVAGEIDGDRAQQFPQMIAELRRNGRLLEMSCNGWGASIDGFSCAARMLWEETRT